MKLMAANKHQPLFPIELMAKDLSYAQDWARQQKSDSSALDLAYQTFPALSRGWGDQHVTAIAKHIDGTAKRSTSSSSKFSPV